MFYLYTNSIFLKLTIECFEFMDAQSRPSNKPIRRLNLLSKLLILVSIR